MTDLGTVVITLGHGSEFKIDGQGMLSLVHRSQAGAITSIALGPATRRRINNISEHLLRLKIHAIDAEEASYGVS